jgi:hypothetical protein
MDDIGRAALPRKTLAVMEIASLHPLPFVEGDLVGFCQALYTHDEQLVQLTAGLPKDRCHQMPVVNNIDFDLPFAKTRNVASIGVAAYKHNFDHARAMLSKTRHLGEYLVFSMPTGTDLDTAQGLAPIRYRGLEWDPQTLYSGFDCLFHVPDHGNGTSIVVSDALACGKAVVLSSLDGYRAAYSGLTGVWFAEDLGYDLSAIMSGYGQGMHAAIKAGYARVYNRDAVLRSWEAAIVG